MTDAPIDGGAEPTIDAGDGDGRQATSDRPAAGPPARAPAVSDLARSNGSTRGRQAGDRPPPGRPLVALDQGRVVADGSPGEVFHDPAVVASYLGDSLLAAAVAPFGAPA